MTGQYPGQQPQYPHQSNYPPQQGGYPQQGQHGQYAQQPSYPQQQQPGGQTAIAVTARYHWFAFAFAMLKPKVFLNGHQLAGSWGRSVLPVQPGQHQLHVHVPYFLPPRIGPADLTVPVQPGQTVELEYRAPLWSFSRGSLGPPPQQYNGVGIMIGILVALLLIFCVCCGVSFLSTL